MSKNLAYLNLENLNSEEEKTIYSMRPNFTSESEYIQTLVKENQQLKSLNNKLYKRTLNQKRKILRLKKQFSKNTESNTTLDTNNDNCNTISNNDCSSNSSNTGAICDDNNSDSGKSKKEVLSDIVWEDVDELLASFTEMPNDLVDGETNKFKLKQL